MADYTDLPDTAVGIGGIPSGTTVTALRDNPIAIAEGAVGAPRIASAAIDVPITFYGAGSNTVDFTFFSNLSLGDYALLRYDFVAEETANDVSASNIQVRMSNNGGSTWSSFVNISALVNRNEASSGSGYIDMRTGTVRGLWSGISNIFSVDATILSGGGNALEIRADVGIGATISAAVIIQPVIGTAT